MDPLLQASVVICTYNRAYLLSLCIESVYALNFSKENYEVLIIDNNSTDDTPAICKDDGAKFPLLNLRYIHESSQGVAYSRTRGAKEAKGDIVAYIDDDCLADPNWLSEIINFYNSHAECMSSGGRIIPEYRVPVADWYGKYFWGLVGNSDLGRSVFQMKGVRYPAGA